ncbi:MAG: hypothetical protein QOI03_795 [Solirubrobacteraceae bacterium]|jgi:hypothetical protein|nr:hypothetical protein [Solirubrobacteraceae bacterium]
MLFPLVITAWLALVALVIAACQGAARAEASALRDAIEPAPVVSVPGLIVWDCGDPAHARRIARKLTASRPTAGHVASVSRTRRPGDERTAPLPLRGRERRCAARS